MKTLILPLVIALYTTWFLAGADSADKKYVCTPCGYTCDNEVHDKPGVCASCGMELVDKSTVVFKTVDFAKLCERIKANKDIVLLDVRSAAEFNNTNPEVQSFGKFKKAINVNITDIPTQAPSLAKYKDQEVVVYCSHSHRSPQVSYYLSTHGFKNVTNVAGGVSVFKESNGAACLKDQYTAFPAKTN
jgi:rhodanese-related sulfurtransferase